MHYGARFYSPRLGRFISADTLVPEHGDKQAAQWPLKVGVFKPQDIARVGEENRQTAQYGFWFQRGPEARQDTVRPTGPTNPQELNRYTYCLGNPLRYVDPSGEQEEFEMFWPWELYKIDAAGVRVNVSYSPFNAVVAGNLSVDVFYNLQDEKLGVFMTPGGMGGAFFGPGDVTVAFLEISDLPSTAEYSGWTAAAGSCIAGGEIGGAAEWNIALSENSEGKKTQSWTIGWAGGGEVALYGGAGRTMQLAEVDRAFQATVFPGGIRVFGRVLAPELHINLKPLFEPH